MTVRAHDLEGKLVHDRSPSMMRVAAGASGFFTLTQSGDRPERYGASRRFDTMPSRPSAQACRNIGAAAFPPNWLDRARRVFSGRRLPRGTREHSWFPPRAL